LLLALDFAGLCRIADINSFWGLSVPTILIADDAEPIRRNLKAIIAEQDGWLVCGEAVDGPEAVLLAGRLKPDLIILDFAMPILDGMLAARDILKLTPGVQIVLYTLHKNAQLDRAAAKIGIRKVFSKSDDPSELLAGLKELLSPNVAELAPTGPSETCSRLS
jgi:DNA-binding NarL/FixJ family response regulator